MVLAGTSPSEKSESEEELLKERPLTDATDLRKLKPTYSKGAATILQEAYKKHATELASIEDRQHKLSLLTMGIFSAGLTLIASGHFPMTCNLKKTLIFLSLAIVIPSFHYNFELHRLRGVTRELLVRCEIALGLHEEDRFLIGEKLYAKGDIAFGKKGRWIRNSYFLTVGIVCIVFIAVVWHARTQ